MTYVLLASDISGKWDWGEGGGRGQASVSDDLRELLSLTPSFRLLVAHGYSDMVTPYAVSRYVLDHLPPIGDPSRAQLRSIAAGTCSTSTRNRAKPSAPTPRSSINRRNDPRRAPLSWRSATKWQVRNPHPCRRPPTWVLYCDLGSTAARWPE